MVKIIAFFFFVKSYLRVKKYFPIFLLHKNIQFEHISEHKKPVSTYNYLQLILYQCQIVHYLKIILSHFKS